MREVEGGEIYSHGWKRTRLLVKPRQTKGRAIIKPIRKTLEYTDAEVSETLSESDESTDSEPDDWGSRRKLDLR